MVLAQVRVGKFTLLARWVDFLIYFLGVSWIFHDSTQSKWKIYFIVRKAERGSICRSCSMSSPRLVWHFFFMLLSAAVMALRSSRYVCFVIFSHIDPQTKTRVSSIEMEKRAKRMMKSGGGKKGGNKSVTYNFQSSILTEDSFVIISNDAQR